MRDQNAELLVEKLQIDLDCAQGVADELIRVGGSTIVKVEPVSCRFGYQALLTDDAGNSYYIVLGDLGYLETIRSGSVDGELLYGAID